MSPSPSASSSSPSTKPTAPIAGRTPMNYFIWFILFVCAIASSTWGQVFTLKYPNLGMFAAYKMAIPFAWLAWLFLSMGINISHKYDLVTPTQVQFTLMVMQFTTVLIINHFYLHQPLFRSDIIAFFLILFGFAVSFNHMLSKALNRPVPSATPAPSAKPAPAGAPKGEDRKIHLLKHIWGIQPANEYSVLTEGINLGRSE